jgi:hypothetical protein
VSINDVRVTEGDGGSSVGSFTVTFSNPSELGASVDWTTASGSATAPADYAASSGTVAMDPPDDNFQYRLSYPCRCPSWAMRSTSRTSSSPCSCSTRSWPRSGAAPASPRSSTTTRRRPR